MLLRLPLHRFSQLPVAHAWEANRLGQHRLARQSDGRIPGADFLHAKQIADRRDHTALVHAGMIDADSGGQGHDAKIDELIAALASFEPDQFD